MKAALVIMAAGLGSRYGGNKQVDGVGPQGEMLMEYSIYDAVRAGFTKVVFIIKPDMRELMDRLWGDRTLITKTGEPLEVCYAMQDFTSIPDYYTIPAGRTKPFGTAMRCCAPGPISPSPSASSTPTTTTAWMPTGPCMRSFSACPGRDGPPWWGIC